MKAFDGRAGVKYLKTLGFTGGDGQKSLSDALVKGRAFGVEPGGRFAFGFTASSGEPGLGFLDRQIEQQREVRGKTVGGERDQRFDDGEVGLASVALIGAGRIGEAVADDDAAPVERGADARCDVLRAVGGEKEGFGPVGERFLGAGIQQEASDFGAHGGAAGFPGQDDLPVPGSQSFKKFDGLGRFPTAVNAFKRDEKTA